MLNISSVYIMKFQFSVSISVSFSYPSDKNTASLCLVNSIFVIFILCIIMNKSSHIKQFLLLGCECYCNAAPIPFDGSTSRSSVTPSAYFHLLHDGVWERFPVPCSFRSARYVHNSPVQYQCIQSGWVSFL